MIRKRLLAAGTVLAAGLVLAVSPSSPAQAYLNCDVANPPPSCDPYSYSNPTGTATFDQNGQRYTNQIGAVDIKGSADDADGGPVTVDITINGTLSTSVVANGYNSSTGSYDAYSSTVQIPIGTPNVCAVARNYGGGSSVTLGCYVAHGPVGKLEIASLSGYTSTLTGWVVDPDTTGPVQLRFETWDALLGTQDTYYTANLYRSDAGTAYPSSYGPYHGFSVTFTQPDHSCLNVYAVNISTGVDSWVYEQPFCVN